MHSKAELLVEDLEKEAAALKIKPQLLQRRMRKWGMEVGGVRRRPRMATDAHG